MINALLIQGLHGAIAGGKNDEGGNNINNMNNTKGLTCNTSLLGYGACHETRQALFTESR